MKLATITFEEARTRHPKEVTEILAKLGSGKSKHRKATGDKLQWEYKTAVLIEGSGSLGDMLAGKFEAGRLRREVMTLDERVADEVRRTRTSLQGTIGQWAHGVSVANPPEVESRARAAISEHMRERSELDALPPAEQDRQREETLAQLRGQPGFMEVRVQRRR